MYIDKDKGNSERTLLIVRQYTERDASFNIK